jgi:hypothetical protein
LIRSVLAIRNEGGLPLSNGDRLMPEPVLLGRNPEKLSALAAAHDELNWSADAAATLADKSIDIYFDVAAASPRSSLIISDEGLSSETGRGTDFIVLLSGEPQGSLKMRRRAPAEARYDYPFDRRPWRRSPFAGPYSTW